MTATLGPAAEQTGARLVDGGGGASTRQLKVWLTATWPSLTEAVTEYEPADPAAGRPVILPVAGSIESPGGRPVALKVSASPSGSLAISGSVTLSPSALVCGPGLVNVGGRLVLVTVHGNTTVADPPWPSSTVTDTE